MTIKHNHIYHLSDFIKQKDFSEGKFYAYYKKDKTEQSSNEEVTLANATYFIKETNIYSAFTTILFNNLNSLHDPEHVLEYFIIVDDRDPTKIYLASEIIQNYKTCCDYKSSLDKSLGEYDKNNILYCQTKLLDAIAIRTFYGDDDSNIGQHKRESIEKGKKPGDTRQISNNFILTANNIIKNLDPEKAFSFGSETPGFFASILLLINTLQHPKEFIFYENFKQKLQTLASFYLNIDNHSNIRQKINSSIILFLSLQDSIKELSKKSNVKLSIEYDHAKLFKECDDNGIHFFQQKIAFNNNIQYEQFINESPLSINELIKFLIKNSNYSEVEFTFNVQGLKKEITDLEKLRLYIFIYELAFKIFTNKNGEIKEYMDIIFNKIDANKEYFNQKFILDFNSFIKGKVLLNNIATHFIQDSQSYNKNYELDYNNIRDRIFFGLMLNAVKIQKLSKYLSLIAQNDSFNQLNGGDVNEILKILITYEQYLIFSYDKLYSQKENSIYPILTSNILLKQSQKLFTTGINYLFVFFQSEENLLEYNDILSTDQQIDYIFQQAKLVKNKSTLNHCISYKLLMILINNDISFNACSEEELLSNSFKQIKERSKENIAKFKDITKELEEIFDETILEILHKDEKLLARFEGPLNCIDNNQYGFCLDLKQVKTIPDNLSTPRLTNSSNSALPQKTKGILSAFSLGSITKVKSHSPRDKQTIKEKVKKRKSHSPRNLNTISHILSDDQVFSDSEATNSIRRSIPNETEVSSRKSSSSFIGYWKKMTSPKSPDVEEELSPKSGSSSPTSLPSTERTNICDSSQNIYRSTDPTSYKLDDDNYHKKKVNNSGRVRGRGRSRTSSTKQTTRS